MTEGQEDRKEKDGFLPRGGWTMLNGHAIGCRSQAVIDVVPTRRETVADIRAWLAGPAGCRP